MISGPASPGEWDQFWHDSELIGTLRWFGESWNAPMNTPQTKVPVPVGMDCFRCGNYVKITDQGVLLPGDNEFHVYHFACWKMYLLGGF